MQYRDAHTSPVHFRRADWFGLEKDLIWTRIPVHLVAMETRCGVSTYPSAAVCFYMCMWWYIHLYFAVYRLYASVSDVVQSVFLTVHLFTHLSVCPCVLELRSFHTLINTSCEDETLLLWKSRWKMCRNAKQKTSCSSWIPWFINTLAPPQVTHSPHSASQWVCVCGK